MPAGGHSCVGSAMVSVFAVDSAASTHIKDAAEQGYPTRALALEESWTLGTASGAVYANQATVVVPTAQIGALEALDLPDSQNALSMGRLCMENGYGFAWPPFGLPSRFKKTFRC